ncbi:MAG: hypothetical protein ACI4KA_05930 [Oscillospiraceae bacterium]
MSGLNYKKRRKSASPVPTEGLARRHKQLGAQISLSSGTVVPTSRDPVYHMINSFTTKFDAVGKQRAAALGSENAANGRQASDALGQGAAQNTEQSRRAASPFNEQLLRQRHDSPMYRHSRKQLENGSFADRFASYAFNGGNMAAAVLSGESKMMFTSCLTRALGRPVPDSPKQKQLLMQNAVESQVDGTAAKVVFNRHAQSAVGIVLDSIRGASTTLEVFRKLANESGALKDTPLEHRNVDTLRKLYPYLVTNEDKAQLNEYKAQLKALQGDNSPEGVEQRRALEWACNRQSAMLSRKMSEQRRLLTVLTRAQANVKEAEKLFSSDGFAQSVLEEIERLAEDVPPEDENNRSGMDMLADFLAGVLDGAAQQSAEHKAKQDTEQQSTEQSAEQNSAEHKAKRPSARGSASRGRRR